MDYVLTGGEDHALVATFPIGEVPPTWSIIGRVQPAVSAPAGTVLIDGHPWKGPTFGWQHF